MLFMVGIEVPKKPNEAWGIVVPVFEKFELSCVSAVDNEGDIVTEARDAILSMAEIALEQGVMLDELAEPYSDYSQEPEFKFCDRWLAIDMDLTKVCGEPKRVNISLSAVLLARIDAIVKANRARYKDRSYFLSLAASHEIQRQRNSK